MAHLFSAKFLGECREGTVIAWATELRALRLQVQLLLANSLFILGVTSSSPKIPHYEHHSEMAVQRAGRICSLHVASKLYMHARDLWTLLQRVF